MSILLSTVLPIALSGIALPATTAAAAPLPAPAVVQPAKAQAKPLPVKVTPPAAAPAAKPQPAIVTSPQTLLQPPAELIQIRAPQPAPQAAPSAADRAAIIDRVNRAFTEVKAAQGNFTQTDEQGTSSGTFYISRPGKVRFDYKTPELMHIVSDGTSVSIEEPKRDAWDSVPLSSTPLHLFLRSNVDLKNDGSVKKVESANGSWFVTLVDKTGEAEGEMILEFRASDFELLGWRVINGAGAETRVRLSDTKRNVALKPALFVVREPEEHR